MNGRNFPFFKVLAIVLLMLVGTPLWAQNLIVNGDFEQTSGFDYQSISDYNRIWQGGVREGEFIHDFTSTGHGVGGVGSFGGWPANLPGYGGSGYYLLFNGFGGTQNSTNRVWWQPVNVTTQTTYTFKCYVRNLSQSYWLATASPSIIQVKINGSPIGNPVTLDVNNNYDWVEISRTWNSGNVSDTINIEIFDIYAGDPDNGDDFGLDHISFVPNVVYSVNAQDDAASVCLDHEVSVPVVNNDNILPDGNNNNVTVTILTPLNQIHGTTTMPTINNNIITYNYNDANYTGSTADFQYRVTWHGLTSDAWVHISLNRPPTIGNIELPSPITVCEGESLTLPTPSVTPSGSTHGWQVKVNGSWQNVNGNTIPSVTSGYTSVRYYADNQCTPPTIYSEEFQIIVNDEPTVGSISNIVPSSVCAPYTFSFSPPSIDTHGSDLIPSECGWQMQINGQWVPVPNPIEYQHNGCGIRYHAENGCGSSNSNVVQLTVNAIPLVGNITTPAAICAGESFNLTIPSVTWRHTNQGTGSWEIRINGVWQPLTNSNIPYAYNGCSIRYKAVNGCGEAYSANTVNAIVYSTDPIYEGEITACDAIYHHGEYCFENGVYVADTTLPNGCIVEVSWHFTLSEAYTETQTYERCESFTWPKNGQTYYASCTDTYTYESTDPMICDSIFTLNLTINNAPEIAGNLQIESSEICSGGLLIVTEPQVQMNHTGGGRTRWDYATSPNGPFHAFEPTTYHWEYGSYYVRFAAINDCDSTFTNLVQINVNDQPAISGQLESLQVCAGNPLDLPEVGVEWMNHDENDRYAEWQMSTTQEGTYAGFDPSTPMQMTQNGYWVRYMARNSCGEVYLGPVRITVINVEDDWQEHVDCDTVWYAGVSYTEDAVVDEQIDLPCPHVVHHNIIVNHSNRPENDPTMIETVTSCHDEFEWHGHTYYRSDGFQVARWSTENQFGCDSIRELRLDFGDYAIITETPQNYGMGACDEFYWPRNDSTYLYDPQNSYIFDNVFIPGNETVCDSMIYLEFTMGRTWEVEGDSWTECKGFEWNGVIYDEDATVYEVIPTQGTHCDSIISHQLTIIQPTEKDTTLVSCQSVWWNGYHFEEYGDVHTFTFTSQYGCDSIVTVHFTISEATLLPAEVVETCQHSYLWHGSTYEVGGTYYDTVADLISGCDEIYVLELTFAEAETMELGEVTACDQYPWPWAPSGYLTESGEYSYTMQSVEGCDSIVFHLDLTINHSENTGTISGSHDVYVASNLISGIYRYEVDPTGIISDIVWSISNPDWRIVESQDNYCRLRVTTPGSATLVASFRTSSCGEMEKQFEINAGFFGVDEHGIEVNVYPNPTQGTLTVEAEGIESIRLTNMIGQLLMWNEYDHSDSVGLNLNGLAPSVYLLEIKTMNGTARQRVVLQR